MLEGIEKEVTAEVEVAVDAALAADPPGPEELLLDVFSSGEALPR